MTKMKLSDSEILESFKKQLRLLQRHCELYDKGEIDLFMDIATKLRVLLHHNPNNSSKALLYQANIQDLPFLTTSTIYNDRNLLGSHLGLVVMSGNSHSKEFNRSVVRYTPRIDFANSDENSFIAFENWWDKEIVLSDSKHKTYTRKSIVRAVVDTDGGAHVDPSLDTDYYNVTRGNSVGFSKEYGDNSEYATNPIPPSIRQIAYEFISSVAKSAKL